MIGSQYDDGVAQADSPIDFLEKLIENQIQAKQLVHSFLAIWAVGVADAIGIGKSDRKNIRVDVFSKVICLHRFQRERESDLVAVGIAAKLIVETELRRIGLKVVRENDVLAIRFSVNRIRAGILLIDRHVR